MYETRFDLLKSLDVFVCVSETGSMTAAAEMLGITQAAVSHQIKLLETDLEKSLIDRSVRPLRLTTAGSILRKFAIDLLRNANEMRSTVRRIGGDSLNGLRLVVIGSLVGTLVPQIVPKLMDELNIRNISVRRGLASAQSNALVRREADLLITADSMFEIAQLERHMLYTEPFILVTPAGRAYRKASLQDLGQALPFIRFTGRFVTGRVIETHIHRLRLEFPVVLEFDSSDDVMGMVAENRGWTITTPSHVVHALRPETRLQIMPLPGPGLRRTVFLIAREDELGVLPHRIATLVREIIRTKHLPRLCKLAPWLREQLTFHPAQSSSL